MAVEWQPAALLRIVVRADLVAIVFRRLFQVL
jgi:hypothetical protein